MTWLCNPATLDMDICRNHTGMAMVYSEGTVRQKSWDVVDREAAVDCFYVYGSVSHDPNKFDEWMAWEEERLRMP